MVTFLRRIYQNTLTALHFFYRIARGIDHKILNHYILKISQAQDINSIIYQVSRCLYYIFDYQFFTFALYDKEYNGSVDVWLDPKTDNLSLIDFIKKDFSPQNLYWNVNYFNHTPYGSCDDPDDIAAKTLSFKVLDNQTCAILYILPRRKMLGYHNNLLNMIVRIVAAALSNFISMKKLENAALIDPLTHSYNRRALDQFINHDIANAERYGAELGVIMFDIDYFKQVNDLHGHKAGDAALRAVSRSVLAAIRKSDYLARYGGEEFVLVLPGTKFSKAIELAERLRQITENLKINFGDSTISVTASFGIAAFKKGINRYTLLQKADEMLYEAKRQGRNRIKPDLRLYHALSDAPFPSMGGEGSLSQ